MGCPLLLETCVGTEGWAGSKAVVLGLVNAVMSGFLLLFTAGSPPQNFAFEDSLDTPGVVLS